MKILSIETSCDETAVSIVEAEGNFPEATYTILGNGLYSQVATHAPYGGVFPMLAKREHTKNLVPMLQVALEEAELLQTGATDLSPDQISQLETMLEREPELASQLKRFLEQYELPEFDLIAVTNGPGLEPALWVGVNFAKTLGTLFSIPVLPANHMEGHILASIFDIEEDDQLARIDFPALALLISGGHTELVLMEGWTTYEKVGVTKDDAVGEAFDKVARLLSLPYPGGPEIEKLATEASKRQLPPYKADMPRPMMASGDLNFSFSGIKTSVRYAVEGKTLSEEEKMALARDFSDAVKEVLLFKTKQAIDLYGVKTLIVGGGVSASSFLRETFKREILNSHPECPVYFPHKELSTDNATMIALVGHARKDQARTGASMARIEADGNLSLA